MKTKNVRRLKDWQYWLKQSTNSVDLDIPPGEKDRDPLCPSNDQRSKWAEESLKTFALLTGPDELKFVVGDFLADLGHFCDRHNIDIQWCLKSAASNYGAETDGKGAQFTEVS